VSDTSNLMMFFRVGPCLLAQRNGCIGVAVVIFLLLVVTPNLEGCHGDNDLDSRRVNIVDVDVDVDKGSLIVAVAIMVDVTSTMYGD